MLDSDELAVNRALWTIVNEQFTDARARQAWAAEDFAWGLFGNSERRLRVLGDVAGLDVVELGCGTAYVSAWLARLGARPVGVDLTPAQLDTARRCQQEFGLSFPLVEANAEDVPLPDGSFDLAVSEYGACVWCDPERWIPEAARLLRPGGRLVFLTNSVQAMLCVPEDGGHAGSGCCGRRREPSGCSGRAAGSSSIPVTANGSASCAPAGSPSKASTSCTPPTTPRHTSTTTSPRLSGRGSGRSRTCGPHG